MRAWLEWLAPGGPPTGALPVPAPGTPPLPPPVPAAATASDATEPTEEQCEACNQEQCEVWNHQIHVEEALFWANLQAETGRSRDQWFAWLDGLAGMAQRNGMLDFLQRQAGFSFRWAIVLQRAWSQSRNGAAPAPAPEPGSEPGPTPAAPPAAGDSPATVASGDSTVAAATARPRRSRPKPAPTPAPAGLLTRPPEEHAQALLRWLWAAGRTGWVLARDAQAAYAAMCEAHRWLPHNWNQTGYHFRKMIEGDTPPPGHYDHPTDGGKRRSLRRYLVPPPDQDEEPGAGDSAGPALRAAA
jgi:hypothetical protein